MEASLYIHVPFCRAKCDYCDFFSLPLQEEKTLDRYIEALLGEIDGILEGGGLPGPQSGTQRPSCPAPLRASPLRGLALPPNLA
jgi:hypothetical protein